MDAPIQDLLPVAPLGVPFNKIGRPCIDDFYKNSTAASTARNILQSHDNSYAKNAPTFAPSDDESINSSEPCVTDKFSLDSDNYHFNCCKFHNDSEEDEIETATGDSIDVRSSTDSASNLALLVLSFLAFYSILVLIS